MGGFGIGYVGQMKFLLEAASKHFGVPKSTPVEPCRE